MIFKVGVNVKDGGKYAFLGMESREAGDAVIKALNLQVPFDRDDGLEEHDNDVLDADHVDNEGRGNVKRPILACNSCHGSPFISPI